jgi:tRNA (guanosine-2'-O-)-methyltransferase
MRAFASDELREHRLRTATVRIPLQVAALWPKTGENLGTLARTCDAVGAEMVVPMDALASRALRKGNTIGIHNTIHRQVGNPLAYLRASTLTKVALELTDESIDLRDLPGLDVLGPTILVLGHETTGVPAEALALCDLAVAIPMTGVGNSLNVAVAASLAIYKLVGWV